MTREIQTLLLLLVVLVIVALSAQRSRVAPAVLMVVAGIVVALVPGLPRYELAPEFMLLVVLPPLIYNAGVEMSWREFRFNLRPIVLLAVGCVVFSAAAVAAAVHWLLGLHWAIGFLLGAIVAPPDVVAPLSVARRLHMPRRVLVILEGEGLVNDATALILYRFTVVAIATGAFSMRAATATFLVIVFGEIAYGIALGWASLRLRKWARNPRVEITLSLLTPYLAYWLPAHLGGSGVIATVATGLYVSWNGPLMISAATRLQGIFFWDFVIYLVEGLVFLYTGLQIRLVFERISSIQLSSLFELTLLTTIVLVIARFVWVFPATYVPRWLSKSLARRDPAPMWQAPFVIAFTGVRGVVSLSAALALPLATAAGTPFPFRDGILFVTFGVIVITLLGEGLALPAILGRLGLAQGGLEEQAREHAAELAARVEAIEAMRRRLDALKGERQLSDDALQLLAAREADRLQMIPKDLGDGFEQSRSSSALLSELIAEERRFLFEKLRAGQLTDEARRRIERELDLEEAAIANRLRSDAA